jgi:serine/threonine protein kinase
MSIQTCRMAAQRYQFGTGRHAGTGGYGNVVAFPDALQDGAPKPCAVKTFKSCDDASIVREVSIVKRLVHPNIVRIYDTVSVTSESFAMVMELMDGDLVHLYENYTLLEDHVRSAVRQLLSALVYIHQRDLLHRDIKTSNAVYTFDGDALVVKVCDFGLTRQVAASMTPRMMTVDYRAPEISDKYNSRYTQAVDVWGVGMIACELIIGARFTRHRHAGVENETNFFTAVREHDLYDDYMATMRRCLDKTAMATSPDAASFVEQALSLDPLRRGTAAQLLKHPWLQ